MSRHTPFGQSTLLALLCAPILLVAVVPARAQVFIVEPEHINPRYSHFAPTHLQLPPGPMTTLDRQQLIRFLQSEQGFAVRPLPVANLTLIANGSMQPAGDQYVHLLHAKGISAKPGDRMVVSNIRIHDRSIILDLNGGPHHKHRFLRHISMDPYDDTPIVPDDGVPPSGSQLTLFFEHGIPNLTGQQVEQLLKPLIDFGVKSRAEAYAETLPSFLRDAIQQHRVLVGMDHDMVRYAKGSPVRRMREQEDGQPVEIWIYGETPQAVEFVRFVHNMVVRVEIARVGEPVEVHATNEMGNYWGNRPAVASNQHEIEFGDRSAHDIQQESAAKAPPTLRQPGEKLPSDGDKNAPATVAPVNFPPDQQRPGDPGYTPTVSTQPPATGDASQAQPPASSGPAQSPPQ